MEPIHIQEKLDNRWFTLGYLPALEIDPETARRAVLRGTWQGTDGNTYRWASGYHRPV